MPVKTVGNNAKNISENIVKLKVQQNIKSLLYNHLVYIWAEETDFWQFFDKPGLWVKIEDTVHS